MPYGRFDLGITVAYDVYLSAVYEVERKLLGCLNKSSGN